MKNISHTACLLCCLAVISCEVEFDFSDLDDNPLFLIDGNVAAATPGDEDGSFQMYLYAVPSAAGEREFDEDARCTLRVFRNSELTDTKDYISIRSFYGLIADSYPAEPGDEFMVTAEAEGFPTATARAVIPAIPPALDVGCSMDDGKLDLRFSFEDNADTDDAYAFCFRTVTQEVRPDPDQIGYAVELPFGNSTGAVLPDPGPFDATWVDGERFYGISDDTFNGCRKEFVISIPSELFDGIGTTYFRIEIRSISPERLRYETAQNDKQSNILGFIGLAPVTFAYTNVSGGAGCFSCSNSGYSDWIEIGPAGNSDTGTVSPDSAG